MRSTIEHVDVYREAGRFAGWPANYGIWSWGEEIVLGFTLGFMKVAEGLFHLRDTSRPFTAMQARSLDGGRTWTTRPFPGPVPGENGLAPEHLDPALRRTDAVDRLEACPGGVDFTAPGFALMAGRTGLLKGARSFFYVTNDRCRTWNGPYALPLFGQTGVAARTDYQALGPSECLLFLTASKTDGAQGKTLCVRTCDGGASFDLVSDIGPEIQGEGSAIMPASLRLPGGGLLVARRRGGPVGGVKPWRHWIDLYRSDDDGVSWRYLNDPVSSTGINGNPPTLNRLPDGRLCLIYGYRDKPHGIRAVLSEDDGKTWSAPVRLRDDGGTPDLGYPRTVVLADGAVVTAYYFADTFEGERYIAATRWRP